jgi:type II secretory pathway component PulF
MSTFGENEVKGNIEEVVNHVEDYLETQGKLTKYKAIEKSAVAGGVLVSNFLVVFFFLIVVLFLSFALAYFISDYFGKDYIGFLCVGALYLLVGIILYVKRENWVQHSVTNSIVKSMLKSDETN